MDDDAIEVVARRVAEMLDARRAPASYLGTAAVGRMLDVSEEWVRDHPAELGAVRLAITAVVSCASSTSGWACTR